MSAPIRANDLRTHTGRSSGERKALKALRRAFIDANPNLPAEVICQEFKERGWISRTTFSQDVIRSIKNYRAHVRRN